MEEIWILRIPGPYAYHREINQKNAFWRRDHSTNVSNKRQDKLNPNHEARNRAHHRDQASRGRARRCQDNWSDAAVGCPARSADLRDFSRWGTENRLRARAKFAIRSRVAVSVPLHEDRSRNLLCRAGVFALCAQQESVQDHDTVLWAFLSLEEHLQILVGLSWGIQVLPLRTFQDHSGDICWRFVRESGQLWALHILAAVEDLPWRLEHEAASVLVSWAERAPLQLELLRPLLHHWGGSV